MRPVEVTDINAGIVFKRLYGFANFREMLRHRTKKSKVNNGDTVRIKYLRKPFDKGYYPNWTDTVEQVTSVIKGDIKPYPYYTLKNITGRFYPEEIQKILPDLYREEKIIKRRTQRGVKQCLVKWLGYPESYNSWELEEDIIH